MEAATEVAVSEPPVISVRPEATVRVSKKSEVAILSCLATGNPAPLLVWAKNGREFFYPGSQDDNRIFIEVRSVAFNFQPPLNDCCSYSCESRHFWLDNNFCKRETSDNAK